MVDSRLDADVQGHMQSHKKIKLWGWVFACVINCLNILSHDWQFSSANFVPCHPTVNNKLFVSCYSCKRRSWLYFECTYPPLALQIFLYPEAGIERIRGEGKSGNMGDARAQAGIISGEGINSIFAESGTDQVSAEQCTFTVIVWYTLILFGIGKSFKMINLSHYQNII